MLYNSNKISKLQYTLETAIQCIQNGKGVKYHGSSDLFSNLVYCVVGVAASKTDCVSKHPYLLAGES